MDEFEIIKRCFRERTAPRSGTVLGIGDDAALLDTGGLPLAHAVATVRFSARDDARAVACRVFGAAFIRLAARAVTPRWATLGITLPSSDLDWIEPFSDIASALCDACAVELIGGDTTRGPGRVTVFALGAGSGLAREDSSRPNADAVAVQLSLATVGTSRQAFANLVSTLVDLAKRGTDIRFGDASVANTATHTLEFTARTDAAGMTALCAVAVRRRIVIAQVDADG